MYAIIFPRSVYWSKQVEDLFPESVNANRDQSTITVKFSKDFDEDYQRKLRGIVVTFAKENRDHQVPIHNVPA